MQQSTKEYDEILSNVDDEAYISTKYKYLKTLFETNTEARSYIEKMLSEGVKYRPIRLILALNLTFNSNLFLNYLKHAVNLSESFYGLVVRLRIQKLINNTVYSQIMSIFDLQNNLRYESIKRKMFLEFMEKEREKQILQYREYMIQKWKKCVDTVCDQKPLSILDFRNDRKEYVQGVIFNPQKLFLIDITDLLSFDHFKCLEEKTNENSLPFYLKKELNNIPNDEKFRVYNKIKGLANKITQMYSNKEETRRNISIIARICMGFLSPDIAILKIIMRTVLDKLKQIVEIVSLRTNHKIVFITNNTLEMTLPFLQLFKDELKITLQNLQSFGNIGLDAFLNNINHDYHAICYVGPYWENIHIGNVFVIDEQCFFDRI